MKKFFTLFVVSCIILLGVLPITTATAMIQAVFYVSPSGSDSNPGTETQPFLTISKARDIVRTINNNMTGDIIVYLKGGTYTQNSTLLFNQNDSGTGGHKIIYKNCEGENPVICGGQEITGWMLEDAAKNVYKAYVGTSFTFDTLYENGIRAVKARYPNTGYLHTVDGSDGFTNHTSGPPEAQGTYLEAWLQVGYGEIPNWSGMEDGEVNIWGYWDWFNSTLPIDSFDYANRKIYLSRPPMWGIQKPGTAPYGYLQDSDDRYFIQGVKSALDVPGEFYLDKTEGYLYYIPRGAQIGNQQIVAPLVKNIIEFKGGSQSSVVCNIVMEGIAVAVSDFSNTYDYWSDPNYPIQRVPDGTASYYENIEPAANRHGNIYCENAENITLKYMEIYDSGYSGVILNNLCRNINIFDSRIHDTGFHGISLIGANNNFDTLASQNNLIENNDIFNIGQLVGHSAGVSILASAGNMLRHNDIHNGPRHGIHIMGAMDLEPTQNLAANNVVEFNHVYDLNKDSADTGNIYQFASGRNNRYDHNYVHDSYAIAFPTSIFLDNHTDYATVSNNIVYGPATIGQNDNYPTVTLSNNVLSSDPAQWTSAGLDCTQMGRVNLASVMNGGIATASSYLTLYGGCPPARLNDNASTVGYWNDSTWNSYPDWCEINWNTVKTVNEVKLRLPIMPNNTQAQRTIGSMTLQYKDSSGNYHDIRTVTNWTAPVTKDGTQTRSFTFSEISTSAIRVRFDSGNVDGWSFMEEIQIYGPSDNQALQVNGGMTAVSSYLTLYGGCPPTKLNDRASYGYWNDSTWNSYPDWCEINWSENRNVSTIKLRLPVMPNNTLGQRTIGSMTLQYKDNNGNYQDISTVTGWVAPTINDGTQIRNFSFPQILTSAIRVKFDSGNIDGWSFMEEIEIY